ncbi:universal stress protein [Sphingosinicella rhizophila]|uniref:Universal stress protein n=1 Tax=Sphingosinicella rhizophila TaxID=3050082 RepID=A0ABU3QBP1_9SPHN|nr:universal stress protein [Sphingosinicella sp. GR2756]MDT9600816.1 universal stress protein [Sphingosinicella sp. GR2756]
MKNVLLLVHEDPGQEARLQAALDLTRALEGHLVCLDVADLYAPAAAMVNVPVEVSDMEEDRLDRRTRLEDRLAREGVSWTMNQALGDLAACITRAAGLSDVIVLNRRLDSDPVPDMRGIVSQVVLKARKPVLAVAESCQGIDFSGPALVSWDGSLPATAALTASVPMLKLARSVNLLEIQGSSSGTVRDAAIYLSRHGVHADVDLLACFKDSAHETSAVIREVCLQNAYSYCVMGAYGNSLVRETLLGGVTRRMLAFSETPLLLAH